MKKLFILFFCVLFIPEGFSQKTLPAWEEGYLDIHHINTGCGECTYIIFPDATTMLIDAGENNPKPERHVVPPTSKPAGEVIVEYIRTFAPKENRDLDYVLLTHFHSDHIGGYRKKEYFNGSYYITGISRVAQELKIHTLVDRGYPSYDFLCDTNDKTFANYLMFLNDKKINFERERFKVGSSSQFTLKRDTARTDFKVTNIYANGQLWNKNTGETEYLFPDFSTLQKWDLPRENTLSCVIKLDYGKFSYYTGGDISGYPRPGRSPFHDVETPIAAQVGKVDICIVNHHGNNDATNDTFISTLRPRFFLILASDALHPNHTALYRMLSKELYPDKRDVLATNLHPAAKVVIGDLTDKMKSQKGHIVVRVAPGGEEYTVYVLNEKNTKGSIVQTFGPIKSNSN